MKPTTPQKSNQEKIETLKRWQAAGFVHPLTCLKDSRHPLPEPQEIKGEVVLVCPKCKSVQKNLPHSILELDPEILERTSNPLVALCKYKNPAPGNRQACCEEPGWSRTRPTEQI
jgi:hypothetical protein